MLLLFRSLFSLLRSFFMQRFCTLSLYLSLLLIYHVDQESRDTRRASQRNALMRAPSHPSTNTNTPSSPRQSAVLLAENLRGEMQRSGRSSQFTLQGRHKALKELNLTEDMPTAKCHNRNLLLLLIRSTTIGNPARGKNTSSSRPRRRSTHAALIPTTTTTTNAPTPRHCVQQSLQGHFNTIRRSLACF